MTKSEMMRNWKETSAIKSEFTKTLGERFPHICYTDQKLLDEIKTTLTGLTKKISAVKDGKPEVELKVEKTPKAKATKVGETTVKTGVKVGAKVKSEKVVA